MESLSWGYYLLFIVVFILPIIAVILGFMASSRLPTTNSTNTNKTAASLIFWGSVIAAVGLIFMLPIVFYPLIFIAPLLLVLIAAILISVGIEYIVVSNNGTNNDARTLAITSAILLFITFIFLFFFIIPVYNRNTTVVLPTPTPILQTPTPLPEVINLPCEQICDNYIEECKPICPIDLNKPDVFQYKMNYNFCL